MAGLDMDSLADLAGVGPEEYVARRRALIEAEICAAAPDRRERLRELQSAIEVMRAKTLDPERILVELLAMLADRVSMLGSAAERLQAAVCMSEQTAASSCSLLRAPRSE
ncbi:hypothetical protein GCM10025771_34070 [Niveibacterium umoris]|uniref:Uncharacterized protein n=1 Tax=Niveibacterium umoris TaxID=1193620 RepID=A0A840BEF4_9RHOO|nr:DUF3135 domain-containing protein [Niveibacterium umoris]MBB4011400.1 hypothetical protein [Niveibacterium umoris]